MSNSEEQQKQIVDRLVAVLGAEADKDDLPTDLYKLIHKDLTDYCALSTAMATEKLRVVPVRWGGNEFERLRVSLQEQLKGDADFFVDDVTDRYDVFEWVDELQPTIGLFPLYRIPDRRSKWCIIKLGVQEKVCLALTNDAATALQERIDCAPELTSPGHRSVFDREGFLRLLERLKEKNIVSRFIAFGPGHAAPKILAQAIDANYPALRYFLRSICYAHDIPLVQSHRARNLQALVSQHQDKADPVRYTFENSRGQGRVRKALTSGTVAGLAEELRRLERGRYDFVVSDLGAAEFRQLLRDMGEAVLDTGEEVSSTEGDDPLVVWEIKHEQEIPIGIGISKYGLIRIAEARGLGAIHQTIAQWLARIKNEGKAEELAQEYGLKIMADAAAEFEAGRMERLAALRAHIDHICRLLDGGYWATDEAETLRAAGTSIPDTWSVVALDKMLASTASLRDRWGQDDFNEHLANLIAELRNESQ